MDDCCGIAVPLSDLRRLIEQSREQVSVAVNSALVLMYWQIGRRIREDVLRNERAEYGTEIVSTLSRQLSAEYGRGLRRDDASDTIELNRDLLLKQFDLVE